MLRSGKRMWGLECQASAMFSKDNSLPVKPITASLIKSSSA